MSQQAQLDWINAQQQTTMVTLQNLSAINSGSSNIEGLRLMHDKLRALFAPIAENIESIALKPSQQLNDKGQMVNLEQGNLLRFSTRTQAPLQILLCGHMDTVFAATDPFQTSHYLDANHLRGPGVADMKGGLLCMLLALQAWEQSDGAAALGWQVLINPDEETGSLASAPLLRAAAKECHVGMVYEPALADGTLAGARKGSGNFSLLIKGRGAHAGREFEQGRNAIAALAIAMQNLHKLNGKLPGTTINLGRISGGGALNQVAETAVCHFNVRVSKASDIPWFEQQLQDLRATINNLDGITCDIHGGFNRQPKQMTTAAERLFAWLDQCGRSMDIPIKTGPTGGCCDGNNLAAAGLPNIDTLGVRGGNIHTDQEYMVVDSLAERAKLSFLFLQFLAQHQPDVIALTSAERN